MKKTLIARLVVGALATIAAGGAMAGQIQASSVSIAREVITTDAQSVLAPSVAYRFSGDVDARTQAQTFQVQFTLAAGEWAQAPKAKAISVSDGITAQIQDQTAGVPTTNAGYVVSATGLSLDKKTMWATIVVSQGATALIKQPIIALNVTSNVIDGATIGVSGDRGLVNKLYTVVGDLLADYAASGKCVDVKTLAVSFKHYNALMAPGSIASDGNATADEHTRAGATNSATLMTFPTNLKVDVTKSDGAVTLTPGGNLHFAEKTAGTVGKAAWVGSADTMMLGYVSLAQNAVGYDSNLADQYLLTNGITVPATASTNTGVIEAKDLKVVVSATEGFVQGGELGLSTAANCSAIVPETVQAITSANAAGPITLTSVAPLVIAAPVFVCYTNPGDMTIPSSTFSAVATLEKADPGVDMDEQDNICNGPFTSLGGGLKVDLRNYASSKETSGYTSVVRFINNSDSSTADVWAQIIHQDGKLGGWGKLMDLKPRAAKNLTAAEIEAKLTNAPTAAAGDTSAAASTDGAPRLRITSNSGRSIRVQNYLFNAATGQILEGSNAQGVDFEGTDDRAPKSEGQYQIQDANSGLNLQ